MLKAMAQWIAKALATFDSRPDLSVAAITESGGTFYRHEPRASPGASGPWSRDAGSLSSSSSRPASG
jgi:hypothetical protein